MIFAANAEPVLDKILSQIVYCISKKLKDPVEIIDPLYIQEFDQQLIVPICFIQALENPDLNDSLKNMRSILSYSKSFLYMTLNYSNYIQNLCGNSESTIWGFLINNTSPLVMGLLQSYDARTSTLEELKREWCEKKVNYSPYDAVKSKVVNNFSLVNFYALMFLMKGKFREESVEREKVTWWKFKRDEYGNSITTDGFWGLISCFGLICGGVFFLLFFLFYCYSLYFLKNLFPERFERIGEERMNDFPLKLFYEIICVVFWEKRIRDAVEGKRSEIENVVMIAADEGWEGKIIINKKLARSHKN